MKEASSKSKQLNSINMSNVISSPGLADGLSLSNSPHGQPLEKSGQDHAHVSPTPPQERRKETQTRETCGRRSTGSYNSAVLTKCLVSRLKTRLATNGSMEYKQTWREKVTPLGIAYWAHTASVPRTSDKDSTGWRTPQANNGSSGAVSKKSSHPRQILTLQSQAALAGWPTPQNHDSREQGKGRPVLANGRIATHNGKSYSANLPMVAGWATPTTRDHKDGTSIGTAPTNSLLGRQVWLLPAQTENRGALNPAHSRWLMGFPAVWDYCGVMAMQSCHKSRRNSSARG